MARKEHRSSCAGGVSREAGLSNMCKSRLRRLLSCRCRRCCSIGGRSLCSPALAVAAVRAPVRVAAGDAAVAHAPAAAALAQVGGAGTALGSTHLHYRSGRCSRGGAKLLELLLSVCCCGAVLPPAASPTAAPVATAAAVAAADAAEAPSPPPLALLVLRTPACREATSPNDI